MSDEARPPDAPAPPPPSATPAPAAQAPPPQVVYVEKQGNGMAVASLVLGLVGALFGLIPFLFFIAWICGILALVFGLVARGRAKKSGAPGKGMATAGFILGIVAIGLGIWGVVIVVTATDELTKNLEELQDLFPTP